MSKCLILISILLAAPAAAVEPAAVARAVETAAAKPHPRLILTKAVENDVRGRLATDPDLRRFLDGLRADADALLDVPPNERKQVGRRLLGVSRDVLSRVLRLAAVYRFTGEKKYLLRAGKEMLAAASFTDWNPSHYLDVAEMTTALAFGYDWLHDDLSPATRDALREALLEKGLGTYKGRDDTNNWNDVCNGGMIMAALAIAGEHPELSAATIQKAVDLLPLALETYAPEGGHPEGPGFYWSYATLYAVPTIASLESAAGTDFGLIGRFPGFMAGANYFLHMHGATGNYFNFSDSAQGKPSFQPQTLWFARRLDDPSLLWFQAKLLRRGIGAGRMGPLALAWWPESLKEAVPDALHYQTGGITPVATHRTSWTDPDAAFIGFKGGEGDGPHGHLDIGSFIYESDGVRWALDLGAEPYHDIEARGMNLWGRQQDSERWTIFRLNNHSHNTLVVNGELQRVDGKGVITHRSPDATVMDIGSLYAPMLARAVRGVRLHADGRASVQDELRAGGGEASVRWAMLTGASVTLDGSKAVLEQDGESLELAVLSPSGVKLEIYPSDPPPEEWDSPNPGTSLVGFRLDLAPDEPARVDVLLTPGSVSAAAAQRLQPLPR